jgi:hypothetical protein
MKANVIVKRSLATVGTVCAAWEVFSIMYAMTIGLAAPTQTVQNTDSTFGQVASAFFNLPTGGIMVVTVLSVYAIIYLIWNREMVQRNFSKYFEKFFEE